MRLIDFTKYNGLMKFSIMVFFFIKLHILVKCCLCNSWFTSPILRVGIVILYLHNIGEQLVHFALGLRKLGGGIGIKKVVLGATGTRLV